VGRLKKNNRFVESITHEFYMPIMTPTLYTPLEYSDDNQFVFAREMKTSYVFFFFLQLLV